MSTRLFSTTFAILLSVTLIFPSAFLVAPQRVHAVGLGIPVFDLPTEIKTAYIAVKATLSEIHDFTTMVATEAQLFNTMVLQPLAFVLSGNLMKALTTSVIAFVIGKANGTGVPQFVTDVQKSFQTVADSQALAYLNQMQRNSNSPFKSAIGFSLRKQYLNQTSLAGFWTANMNTLARSSPNVNAYLSGNWSQGGVAAWFALTTQIQNNPYTAYGAAEVAMGTRIGSGPSGAVGARAAELSAGSGFTSWCGASDTSNAAEASADADDRDTTSQTSTGVNPGDPCTNKDGTPGTIRTPGSVIVSTLNKVLGGQQDQITRMGNVGPEINGILSNIATVMKTVNFAADILGNASLSTATGGLLGADEPSSSGSTSRLLQYQNESGNLGVTNTTIYNNAANDQISGPDMLTRLTQYQSAWNTIVTAANSASTTLASLASYCIAQQAVAPTVLNNGYGQSVASFVSASNAQAAAARTAISIDIASIFAQARTASTTASTTRAFVQKIQDERESSSDTGASDYATDIQMLQTMTPTSRDLVNLQEEAQTSGGATAVPEGSLTVSGGTMMDRINLLSSNATALRASVCTPIHVDPPSDDG